MKAGGKSITIALLCLAGGLGILWAVIAVPPWIREGRVIARLKTKDRQEQIKVTQALAEMGSARAIPAILEAMWQRKPEGSDHVNFREALKSIIEKRGRETVAPLVRELKSPDSFVRQTACEALGDLGAEAGIAIPSLEELRGDSDPAVRVKAAKALFEVGAKEESYLPVLDKVIRDQQTSLKFDALKALSEIAVAEKSPASIQSLIRALEGQGAPLVSSCLGILERLGIAASAAIPAVMEKVEDPKVGFSALECLGSIGAEHEGTWSLLLVALDDEEARVRAAAARAFLKMGSRAGPALPDLKRLAESDSDPDVRASAACIVLDLEPNNKLAASAVKTARNSPVNRWLSAGLRSNLGDRTGFSSTEAALLSTGIEDQQMRLLLETLKDPDHKVRRRALFFLEYLGPSAKPALGAIIEAARDPQSVVRVQAARTLGAMGAAAVESIPALNELLKERNAAIRDNARQALMRIKKSMKTRGEPIAIALLCLAGGVGIYWAAIALLPWIREEWVLARLKSPDPKVQDETTIALAEMGSVKAIPRILELGMRRSSFNFMDPMKLIIKKRGYDAVVPLVGALKSSDRTIRQSACELLGDLGTEARMVIPRLTELLDDPHPSVRAQAAKALFDIGAEEGSYSPVLAQFGQHHDMAELGILQEIALVEKKQWLVSALTQALKDNDLQISWISLHSLGLVGAEASSAIPAVLEKAQDPDSNMRQLALEALSAIGSEREEVMAHFLAALSDPESRTRAMAATGLLKMGSRAAPALTALKGLLESDGDESVRASAACCVLKLEPENLLAAKIVGVARESVVKGVTTFDSSQAAVLSTGIEDHQIGILTDALRSTDPRWRLRALHCFELLGPAAKPAIGAIIDSTKDSDRFLRSQAIGALGAIGPGAAEAVPALNEILKARNAEARNQARRTLAQIQKVPNSP